MELELGIIISLIIAAFGIGVWFNRINNQLKKINNDIMPLILLHEEELIQYYLKKGISPNPGMTPRKQYLIETLRSGSITTNEYQELSAILQREKVEAEKAKNTDALVAILGIIALMGVLYALSKKK